MRSHNTEKIVQIAKLKTEYTKKRVISIIEEMLKNSEKITFYSVCSKALVSKSFVYNNKEIRILIEKYRGKHVKPVQTVSAKDVIIELLKSQIHDLEKKIHDLSKKLDMIKKDELWKEKYEKLLEENKELKKQLEKLYSNQY